MVTDSVTQSKPKMWDRLKNTFLGGDVDSVGRYLVTDVALPAIRNLIVDAATQGIEKMIYGPDSPSKSRSRKRSNYRYDSPSRDNGRPRAYLPDQGPRPNRGGSRQRSRSDAGDIILDTKADADRVLERLHDLIDQYELATVSDLFALMGLDSSYVDNKFGWYELPYSEVKQVREGWLIVIPDAEPIED